MASGGTVEVEIAMIHIGHPVCEICGALLPMEPERVARHADWHAKQNALLAGLRALGG